MQRKRRVSLEEKPIFLIVDALRKAGGVMGLAKEIKVADSAIYNWVDGIHQPNKHHLDMLLDYIEGIEKPVEQPVVVPAKPKPENYASNLGEPKIVRKTVEIDRVFLGGSGKFVAFGTTEKCSVFITPLCVKKIAEQMGSIYEGDSYEFELLEDITRRSDYITHRYVKPA